MRMNAADRPNEQEMVANAVALFPSTFELKNSSGTFRISPSASYVSNYPNPNTVMLYTQIQDGDRWLDFAKGTVLELQSQIIVRQIPVLYVLDENGEANGTVRFYCSEYCRTKALQTNEDPVNKGFNTFFEVLEGTRCEYCEQPVNS